MFCFFFNDTATTEIYTLSLHDALPISRNRLAGAGAQTAALSFGGYDGTNVLATTEAYDGTAWTAGGNLNTARHGLAGAGTSTEIGRAHV